MFDIDYYAEQAIKTDNREFSFKEHLLNGALGIIGEGAEVSEHIKKVYFQQHTFDRDLIKKELGDVVWYVNKMMFDLGLSWSEVCDFNIARLKERYPNGEFSGEASRNRKESKLSGSNDEHLLIPTKRLTY